MEKTICRLTYWLGLASLLVALIWKVVSMFAAWKTAVGTAGEPLGFMSFYKGALLFFVTTIATRAYMSMVPQK